METLHETPTETQRIVMPPRSNRDWGRFFANKDRLARWAILAGFVAGLGNVLMAVCLLHELRRNPEYILIGPGVIEPCTPTDFVGAKELHVQQALLASSALLLRNPSSFDLPELLQSLFTHAALEEAANLKVTEAREFEDRNIQQKPEVARIETLQVRPDQVRIRLTGNLIRTGMFHEQAFSEVVPFVLDVTLVRNPDLLRYHRQPTLVANFQLKYESKH